MSEDGTRPLDNEDNQLLGLTATGEDDAFIQVIMASFGLAIESIARTKVGNNNSSFIVTVKGRAPSSPFEGYTSGTYPLPPLADGESRRVVFTSARLKEDMDAAVMSANKVAAMKLIHDAGGYASTVTPHVYGWSDGKEGGTGAGKSWCLMECMSGRKNSNLALIQVLFCRVYGRISSTIRRSRWSNQLRAS